MMEKFKVEMVSVQQIKRMPCLATGVFKQEVARYKAFAKTRGFCKPVMLSKSKGCYTLLAGSAIYEACLEEKAASIPAVIIPTDNESDDLLFALQSAQLTDTTNIIGVSATIVHLIDVYSVSRKAIADALGRSSAWLCKMETLSRRLIGSVKTLVAEGALAARAAQEVSRLPEDVQMPFALSVIHEYLCKESVTYLVNRYLSEDTSDEEKNRIITAPYLALPVDRPAHGKRSKDSSYSARLYQAVIRTMDVITSLQYLLDRIGKDEVSIRIQDIETLTGKLKELCARLEQDFLPG